MLYSMPFVTLAAALVLGLLFVLCDKLAAKRLRAEEGG